MRSTRSKERPREPRDSPVARTPIWTRLGKETASFLVSQSSVTSIIIWKKFGSTGTLEEDQTWAWGWRKFQTNNHCYSSAPWLTNSRKSDVENQKHIWRTPRLWATPCVDWWRENSFLLILTAGFSVRNSWNFKSVRIPFIATVYSACSSSMLSCGMMAIVVFWHHLFERRWRKSFSRGGCFWNSTFGLYLHFQHVANELTD